MATPSASDLNRPLGVDRAFDQSSPSHDVDYGVRRDRFGKYLDGGAAAGTASWNHAGIPVAGYLFCRPRRNGGDDPAEQADGIIRSVRDMKQTAIMLDAEYDQTTAATISAAELQAIADACDASGIPTFGYWSTGTPPSRAIRHLRGVMAANYSRRPTPGSISGGCPVIAWQFTSRPYDRSVWFDDAAYTECFGRPAVPVPVPSTAGLDIATAEAYPMLDPVPATLHRVVDLPIGTIFRSFPSTSPDARQGVVTADGDHPDQPTRPFGYVAAVKGIAGWIVVKNGPVYVYVRRTDVAGIRSGDTEVT